MVRTSLSEQSILRIIEHICTHQTSDNNSLSLELDLARETVSRCLSDLEKLHLVEKTLDPYDSRRANWAPTLTGIRTVICWHGAKLDDPLIDDIAKAHGQKWVILKEYNFLKESKIAPLVIYRIINSYTPIEFKTPESFSKNYRQILELQEELAGHPLVNSPDFMVTVQNPFKLSTDKLTKMALGLDELRDNGIHPRKLLELEVLVSNQVFRKIVVDELLETEKQLEIIVYLVKKILERTSVESDEAR